ncbi:MAG TPA: hypothetical protein PKY85_03975, partial [Nitrosomonas sp.]|nr:hypothetical protein [Nitrosomonas sp.]
FFYLVPFLSCNWLLEIVFQAIGTSWKQLEKEVLSIDYDGTVLNGVLFCDVICYHKRSFLRINPV